MLFSVVLLRETGNVTLWLGLSDDLTDSGPDGVQVIHALLLATFSLPMKCFRSEKYSLPNFPSVATVLHANNYSHHCSDEGAGCSISVLPYLLLTTLDRAFNGL